MCRDPRALSRARKYEPKNLILTSPVAAKIIFGLERLEKGTRKRSLLEREYRRLKDVIGWADWDERAAEAFGKIKVDLESLGKIIDDEARLVIDTIDLIERL